MNREKRITSIPVPYQIPQICYPRVRKKNRNKVKLPPCEYQTIPLPLKFAYVSDTYHFYGGASLREYKGTLKAETVTLSQYFRCEEVKVTKSSDQKIVTMKLNKLPAFRYPAWQPMIERLEQSDSTDIRRWSGILKDYCLKYEDKLRAWADQEKFRSQYSEDELVKMNQRSEAKIAEYFSKYPCMNFKATLEDNQMQQSEIVLSDRYLEQLGYSIDSFAITTLRDGIPQLIPVDNTMAAKLYIENYHSLEKGDCATSELESELLIRKGYTRKIKFKAHYFATYRDKTFGMDCVVIITGIDSKNYNATTPQEPKFTKTFLKNEIAKEKQTSKFLEQYYNKPFDLKYTNMNKVCKIKDLEHNSS